ncbi:glycosyltransferase family 2 protein [Sulfurimonas sp.]|nr:glycosyltransferase family 2 protein [Sulfurimonas sp.]
MNISVVIPTYNRYEFLKRALESVYAQTYTVSEVIVIDDGSTDETSQIQKEFPQINYIYQKNSGVSSARNLGIKNAMYEWIAFLDSDDTWHRDKLQLQVELHQKRPDLLISYTDESWIRDAKEVKIPKKFRKYDGDIFSECLSHCIIAPSATLLHISLITKVGSFDERLEVCEDYDLWLRIALEHEIGLVDKSLITKYAGHEDQLSFKHWGMDRFRVQSLEKLIESSKKEIVRETLLIKYKLLLKGAIKYDKISDIKEYEGKIKTYE